MDFSLLYSPFSLFAIALGTISALSLLMGAIPGLSYKPSNSLLAVMNAFGAGALLAALCIELVAPMALRELHASESSEHDPDFWVFLGASVLGGCVFFGLDRLVHIKGGFLRRTASMVTYINATRTKKAKRILERLVEIEFLRTIPPADVYRLVDFVKIKEYKQGETLCKAGAEGDCLFFIESGLISVRDENDVEFDVLKSGAVLGEIALLTGAPRNATAVAKTHTVSFLLYKSDFEILRRAIPALEEKATEMASARLQARSEKPTDESAKERTWVADASKALQQRLSIPTSEQLQEVEREIQGAPFAIWLGILFDGIPSSLILGVGLFTTSLTSSVDTVRFLDIVPYPLMAGFMLANFPAGLSTTAGMKRQGWKNWSILMLWFTLFFSFSIGSLFGFLLGYSLDAQSISFMQGLASGAMITMIAQCMLPEAVYLGGPAKVGLTTLAGFLSVVTCSAI